ncbi:MAG: hypothetical protein FWC74_09475 [Candidatus Bathyarchaeota archaeon]|nr:hypothetical protein [Candidatus Termitimicrobium sp.]
MPTLTSPNPRHQRQRQLRLVSFSNEVVEREVVKLQRGLRQLYFKLRRGQISWSTCVEEGTNTIYVAYQGALLRLEEFLRKHGLQFNVENAESVAVLSAAMLAWSNVVFDAAKVEHAIPQPLLINGRVVGVFEGSPSLDYWMSHRGLLRRVDLLGQDFEYSLYNEVMKTAAKENVSYLDLEEAGGVGGLKWLTEEDEKVCDDCVRSGIGGESMDGFYLPHEFELLELPPLHPNCRCRIAIVLYTTKN